MKIKSELFKGYTGLNPFKDHQARPFDKKKVIQEFYPTSTFWSLFNDQHEILVGRRGSGKTILLKMMRYSFLKEMEHEQAKKIISKKKYIGIYAPTHLEFLGAFIHQEVPEKDKLLFFQFSFNCLLSRAFLYEINTIVHEQETVVLRGIKSREISKKIASVWFPGIENSSINKIEDLDEKIINIYENTEIKDGLDNIPRIFKNTICRPIQAVSSLIFKLIGCDEEPTWLICIDEAEFLTKELQRCINTLFRSDSRGIVIKMATLPYRHETTETLIDNEFAESNGHDFSYRKIDMDFDCEDFTNVTNRLSKTRLSTTQLENTPQVESLEDFIGKVGNDDLVDYYKLETNSQRKTYEQLESEIMSQLSDKRKEKDGCKQKNRRKTIYDKFAPIFFVREMYKISKRGNSIPGWYAGTKMIRKISEGNPRRFIRIMDVLFEKSKENKLEPKAQHSVVLEFVKRECDATKSLPIYGPSLYNILEELSKQLQRRIHDKHIIFSGNSFQLSERDFNNNNDLIKCLELGVAYLRINVDEDSYLGKITKDSKFLLSNCFSANYWIPMRISDYPKLEIAAKQLPLPFVKKE